jgi:hypothetical protein
MLPQNSPNLVLRNISKSLGNKSFVPCGIPRRRLLIERNMDFDLPHYKKTGIAGDLCVLKINAD